MRTHVSHRRCAEGHLQVFDTPFVIADDGQTVGPDGDRSAPADNPACIQGGDCGATGTGYIVAVSYSQVVGAVIEVTDAGFKLLERAPGVSVEEIVEKTGAPLIIEGDIPEMKL